MLGPILNAKSILGSYVSYVFPIGAVDKGGELPHLDAHRVDLRIG